MRARLLIIVTFVGLTFGATSTTAQLSPAVPALPCLQRLGSAGCLGPAQVRQSYDVSPLLKRGITGKGRTIAVIVSFGSPTLRSDLHKFDQAFNLPDPHLDIRSPLGTAHTGDGGWRIETTLDVEWAHAIAPGARILVMTSPVDETEGVQGVPQFLSLERNIVQHHLADVISQSWAATEETLMTKRGRALVAQFHKLYTQATKQGITILGATGDDGTAGLDLSLKHFYHHRVVEWPSSDPLVLAVGGTRLTINEQSQDEIAWSGSGGGISKLYSEPSYQRALPAAAQHLLNGRRGLPDVASSAGPLALFFHGRWGVIGGTSASTPQWAGIVALADDAAGHDLGSINDELYRLARSSRYHTDLRDITSGSIKDPPGTPSSLTPLHAGSGWDATTGIGTPHTAALVQDLVSASHRR